MRTPMGLSRLVFAVVLAMAFSLAVGSSAFAEDAANNWFNAAGPLSPGTTQAGGIETVGDTDWYYFYTSGEGEVKLGMNKTSGDSSDFNLYRWDGGKLVYVAYGSTYSSEPTAKRVGAGLYYVKVAGYSPDHVGGYDLTLSGGFVSGACPAGVQADPAPVGVGEDDKADWWSGVHLSQPTRPYVSGIETVGDTDWYYFYTSGEGEVKLGMNATSGDSSDFNLYRWDGGKLVYVAYGSTYSSEPTAKRVGAGLYYVKVAGYSPDHVGGYDLTVVGDRVTTTVVTPTITKHSPAGNKTYARKKGVTNYTLSSSVNGPSGGLPGVTVYLQSRTSTKRAWQNSYPRVTNARGEASVVFKSKKKSTTYYRWAVYSQGSINAAVTGSQKIVVK